MKIEMFVCDIGDDTDIKGTAAYSLQFKSMRSCFNDCVFHVGFYHTSKHLLDFKCL